MRDAFGKGKGQQCVREDGAGGNPHLRLKFEPGLLPVFDGVLVAEAKHRSG
jgi:hypothetical protein